MAEIAFLSRHQTLKAYVRFRSSWHGPVKIPSSRQSTHELTALITSAAVHAAKPSLDRYHAYLYSACKRCTLRPSSGVLPLAVKDSAVADRVGDGYHRGGLLCWIQQVYSQLLPYSHAIYSSQRHLLVHIGVAARCGCIAGDETEEPRFAGRQ